MKKNLDRRCVVKRCVRGVLLLAVLTGGGGAGAEDEQYRWNLADIYVDKQAWRDAKTAASKSFAELEPCKGKLGQSAESLRKCLDTVFAIRKEVARVAGYASMLSDEDTRVDEHAQMRSEARLLFSAFSEETSFLRPELLAVGKSKVAGFVATESGLAIYRHLVIHFTLVGGRVLGSNVSVGQCLTENQLFDESVEDLAYVAGLSTVEAKGEFVEVALEMHFTHLPLVSRSQPALQQRGNQVNMREFLGCQPRVSRRVGDPVAVAGFLQAPVTPPAVGMDQTAWLHTVAHKTHQTRARCVGDMAQTDPPHSAAFQFHRNHNQGFAHKLSPANVLLLAAQVSLVDLDTSAQPFPSQPNHRLPQLRQHQPGRLIAAQTEFTLQTLSAQPCFLGAGQPHCQKPTPQRHPRVVQDGSRSGRGLASAGATEHRASPRRPTLRGRAVRTNESRGPADADQILATGLLAGKPFSELHQMLWKVLAQLPRSSPPTARVQG